MNLEQSSFQTVYDEKDGRFALPQKNELRHSPPAHALKASVHLY